MWCGGMAVASAFKHVQGFRARQMRFKRGRAEEVRAGVGPHMFTKTRGGASRWVKDNRIAEAAEEVEQMGGGFRPVKASHGCSGLTAGGSVARCGGDASMRSCSVGGT
jgi:hypothetical protein